MKSTQLKKEKKISSNINNTIKNSIIAGIIGFLSWLSIYVFWIPLSSLYKVGYFRSRTPLEVLKIEGIYTQPLLVGLIFFLFFYLTLKCKEKSSFAKFIMWTGIILYTLFYLGYLFLLFFFRFTDL